MSDASESTGAAPEGSIKRAAVAWVARRDAGFTSEEKCDFERWRQADPRHRAALAYFDSAWNALAVPSRVGAAADLERELAQIASRRRRRRIAGTAFVAAVVFAGVFSWPALRSPAGVTPSTATLLQPRVQILPDGSRVELNAESEISVGFTDQVRRVALLRGEAHFTVQKNPARPFIVSADGIDIRAVGTAFDVQLGASMVAILVTEGTVSVEKPAASTHAASAASEASSARALAVLNAGHHMEIARTAEAAVSRPRPVSSAESTERLAWRNARVEFTRTPLPEAVSMLNQHASSPHPRLVVTDPALAAVRVTGIFRPDNTDGFVHLLEAGFGIQAERSGNTIVLRVAPQAQ